MRPTRFAFLLAALALAAGCGKSATMSDPEASAQALKQTLDAWKAGKDREEFSRSAAIQTADSRWEAGYKLLDYEAGPGEKHGYDVNFQVTLQLADPKGKKLKEKATYAVNTSPKVVMRLEEM